MSSEKYTDTISNHIDKNSIISDDWTVSDPMSYGTDLYWFRFRIATAVTTVPVDVDFASGLTLTLLRNGFNNNATDGFGDVLTVPEGIDTSIPITAYVTWYADTNNAGDVEIEADVSPHIDTYDGTVTVTNYTDVTTVAANSQYDRQTTEIEIDISDRVVGDEVPFSIFRDATAGNTHDTLSGGIVIVAFRMSAYFWRP